MSYTEPVVVLIRPLQALSIASFKWLCWVTTHIIFLDSIVMSLHVCAQLQWSTDIHIPYNEKILAIVFNLEIWRILPKIAKLKFSLATRTLINYMNYTKFESLLVRVEACETC